MYRVQVCLCMSEHYMTILHLDDRACLSRLSLLFIFVWLLTIVYPRLVASSPIVGETARHILLYLVVSNIHLWTKHTNIYETKEQQGDYCTVQVNPPAKYWWLHIVEFSQFTSGAVNIFIYNNLFFIWTFFKYLSNLDKLPSLSNSYYRK